MSATGPAEAMALLGLAQRAGAVVQGTEGTRKAVRVGQARFVVLARDASDVQLEKIQRILNNRSVPAAFAPDQVALGAAVGGGPLSAVAVTEASFARELERRFRAHVHEGPQGARQGR